MPYWSVCYLTGHRGKNTSCDFAGGLRGRQICLHRNAQVLHITFYLQSDQFAHYRGLFCFIHVYLIQRHRIYHCLYSRSFPIIQKSIMSSWNGIEDDVDSDRQLLSCGCSGDCHSARCVCFKNGAGCTIYCHKRFGECPNKAAGSAYTTITVIEQDKDDEMEE